MRAEQFDLHELIGALLGSSNTIDEALEEIYDCSMTEEDLSFEEKGDLNAQIFKCDSCGWWFMIHEMIEPGTCSECTAEVKEEDGEVDDEE